MEFFYNAVQWAADIYRHQAIYVRGEEEAFEYAVDNGIDDFAPANDDENSNCLPTTSCCQSFLGMEFDISTQPGTMLCMCQFSCKSVSSIVTIACMFWTLVCIFDGMVFDMRTANIYIFTPVNFVLFACEIYIDNQLWNFRKDDHLPYGKKSICFLFICMGLTHLFGHIFLCNNDGKYCLFSAMTFIFYLIAKDSKVPERLKRANRMVSFGFLPIVAIAVYMQAADLDLQNSSFLVLIYVLLDWIPKIFMCEYFNRLVASYGQDTDPAPYMDDEIDVGYRSTLEDIDAGEFSNPTEMDLYNEIPVPFPVVSILGHRESYNLQEDSYVHEDDHHNEQFYEQHNFEPAYYEELTASYPSSKENAKILCDGDPKYNLDFDVDFESYESNMSNYEDLQPVISKSPETESSMGSLFSTAPSPVSFEHQDEVQTSYGTFARKA